MKNKIILLLTILIASSPCAFAIQEGKVISDSKTQKDLMKSLDEVNKYTNNFFTPNIKEKDNKIIESNNYNYNYNYNDNDLKTDPQTHGSIAPVKKLRLRIKQKRLRTKQKGNEKITEIEVETEKNQAILNCEFMEYFAERTELEANGNVVMFFPENNSTLKADKMVYNQTTNFIKAFGNVVLINDGKELFGDYMQIDMNEENALMDNPITDILQIRAKAKKGYMYGDKIIQEQGSIQVTKKTMIDIRSEMFGPNLDMMFVDEKDKSYYMKDSHGSKFKIKTNDLIINSKKEHDTLTLKHAEIYFNGKKLGTIPSITMHTNKSQDYVEADFPEIGTVTNMGLFAGPGFVFDTPRGTTLKVVPVLNYQSTGDSNNNNTDNKIGWGSIIKFKSATNKTDMAYGTANEIFIMRGYQKLDDNLFFQYGSNGYMDDWFMGFRMPKLLGEIVYHETTPFANFLGKDKSMNFTQRIAAGYVQDGGPRTPLFDSEGRIGTMRFKYMNEISQTLYSLGNIRENPINARLDIVGQGSVALYGTGDTQMIARIGPRIHTQYKNWMQDAGYFLSAYNDNTPLRGFDQYMYGRSNAYFRESYRVCKYLTLSLFNSLNLSQDSWDGKMLQENAFYFSVGPDDVKLNIGYDTIRQQSFLTVAMHLDAKGSTIEYKKMTIKNPDTLGKSKNGENKQQSFISSSSEDDETGVERAEVIEMEETL